MVCVAAFIILCLISVVVAFLSIFKRDIGRKYWTVFKKAWHCVFKKVRLQKCDTNFKEDVKNSILSRFILKKPHLVKPISIAIEVISVLIVAITIWSIVIAIKSLLALWVFGTCNVSQPSQCGLGAEACSIDADEPKNLGEKIARGFSEWGEIFGAIPDRLKTWDARDYVSERPSIITNFATDDNLSEIFQHPAALDVIDPGCSVCMQSYRNQQDSNFMDNYAVYVLVYPIQDADGNYKFKNSKTLSDYLIATSIFEQKHSDKLSPIYSAKILHRLFTEKNKDGVNWQSVFNNSLSAEQAAKTIESWLKDFGLDKKQIAEIRKLTSSDQVKEILQKNKDAVETQIHAKGIPTFIYDGKKHNGLYKNQ